MRRPPSDTVILTLRPESKGADHLGRTPELRLRGLLRVALRSFGWRVVTLDTPPAANGGGHGQ